MGLFLSKIRTNYFFFIHLATTNLPNSSYLGVFTNRALCFESLGGMPGPYIKWFLESIGCDGLAKLLNGFENRKAWAQTTFSYTTGDKDAPIHTFVGKTYGNIVPPRGVSKYALFYVLF